MNSSKKDVEAKSIADTCAIVSVLSRENSLNIYSFNFFNTNITHQMNEEDVKEMDAVCDVKLKLRIGNSAIDWPIYIDPTRDKTGKKHPPTNQPLLLVQPLLCRIYTFISWTYPFLSP